VSQPEIETLQDLHAYLRAALQLEHATIPPYLTAMYSIIPGTNSDAYHVLRVVAVEEMLHLTLVANVLNAVGGSPDLTAPDFIPTYPAYLPDGEQDFQVNRQRFCLECIQSFLEIERPHRPPSVEEQVLRQRQPRQSRFGVVPTAPEYQFYCIGEFYEAIDRGIHRLHATMGDALFSGDPARQVTDEFFFSGGGNVVPVTDLESARFALGLIGGQGEGFGGGIYDAEGELSHYYRFQQLTLGRFYLAGDRPDAPTGPPVNVDWDASFPIKTNASVADFPAGSELRAAAEAFNRAYADFLALLTRAFGGEPALLSEAIGGMFRLRDLITQLIHNPIPGMPGTNAAPTFEMSAAARVGSA
jgi:Ferritin-like